MEYSILEKTNFLVVILPPWNITVVVINDKGYFSHDVRRNADF